MMPLPGGEFLPEPDYPDTDYPDYEEPPMKQPPLWLPEGSVRAVLALLMVAPVTVRYAATGLVPDPQLLLMIGGVAAAYGLSRTVGK